MRLSSMLLVLALVGASAAAVDARPNRQGRQVTIPAGTVLRLQLAQPVGSDFSRVEDPVSARLTRSIVVNGQTAVPAGATAYGEVIEAERSGRVKGRARLGLRFTTLAVSDDERYAMRTRAWVREAPGTKKKDAATIAVPATGGAIVGALIDARKGAAIGAAAGGGAGTGVVLATRGKEMRLDRGHVILVRLASPLKVFVPENRDR